MNKPDRARRSTAPPDGDLCGPDGCAPADLDGLLEADDVIDAMADELSAFRLPDLEGPLSADALDPENGETLPAK